METYSDSDSDSDSVRLHLFMVGFRDPCIRTAITFTVEASTRSTL